MDLLDFPFVQAVFAIDKQCKQKAD